MLSVWLASCSSLTPELSAPPDDYRRAVAALDNWSLRGRLNIRSGNDSDTININWQQDADKYNISLSGTLGLGAVHIMGDARSVIIEKAGEDPLVAPSLEAISSDMLGYAFPASELLYWIRALPAPGSRAKQTQNADGLTATLSQGDNQGQHWELQYDRYQDTGGIILPGRIRLERSPYRLTFVISDWMIPGSDE